MRENETDPHESSYGDTFSELMDVLREDDDAGMITFEANLREIQTYLQNDYILAKKSLDYKELEDIENDLIEAWAHESDVATVSGRIYLLDPEAEDLIPDEWGDGLIDDRDDIYYLVDDVRLRSVAAQVLPMFDENGDLDDVKMVYTFAFTDDEDEMPVVSAYVGELFKHTYDQPTPHEAATRLESRWPAQFMLMQEWLHSGSNAQIVQSLRYLVQELQEQLAGSDQFRRLFECYIQSFVTLDKVLPYSISLDGSLDYFDGEGNPYAEDEKGEWLTFIVEGELSLLAYYPKFEMQTMSDGTVRATIIASTFNAEDGDEAEYVRLNVDTISSFRSTRAAASLLSKAIFHGERGSLIEAVSPGGEYDLSVYDTRDEATIELGAQDVVEGDEGVEQVPSKIEYLIAVEEAIAKAVKIVSSRRLLYYDTDEMALQAAERMVSDEVLPLFRSLSVTSDLECTVSGPGVVAPHGSVRVSDDDEFALRHITYTTELKAAASALSPGDAYAGYLLKVVADSAIVAGDDETPEARYYARAALLVSVDKSSYVPVSMNGKPLVDITIDKRLFVPLDGTAEISLTAVDQYRETVAALASLRTEHAQSPTVELLRTLLDSLHNNTLADAYTPFEQSELFAHIESSDGEADLFNGATKVLEKLLVGRLVTVSGDAFVQTGLDTFAPLDSPSADAAVVGKVIDVRTDIESHDIYLAVSTHSDAIAYVRVRSITKFLF